MEEQKQEPLYYLPNEIVRKIISYLDIDTRRSLGIYTKLKIPKTISDSIVNSYKPIIYSRIGYNDLDYTYFINIKIKNSCHFYDIAHSIHKISKASSYNISHIYDISNIGYNSTEIYHYGYKNREIINDDDISRYKYNKTVYRE